MHKDIFFFLMPSFLMLVLLPVVNAQSMSMVQFGISGSITTPEIILEDLGYGTSSILLGTSTGLYVFSSNGDLEKFIQTSASVNNIVILDDLTDDNKQEIVISTDDVYFPNVLCYDLNGNKIWEFSPKTEVYDTYILWTMKQTSVFDMVSIEDLNSNGYKDLVLSSGYNIYALDGRGELLWNFQDSDHVWDLLVVDDQNNDAKQEILAGDQNGYLYLISGGSGKIIWSKYLSKGYTVINPSTNSELGKVKRSVWDLVLLQADGSRVAVSAEDGYVYLLDIRTGDIEWQSKVISYVDSLLYNYYGDYPVPTSRADYNFFNLRIIAIEDVTNDGKSDIIASTFPGPRFGREYKGVKGIYLLDSKDGEIIWRNENTELDYIKQLETLELGKPYLAVPIGKTGIRERIKLIDPKDGSTYDTIGVNTSSGQLRGNVYLLKNVKKNRFIIISSYTDLLSINYPDSVLWSYPRMSNIVIKKADLTGDSTTDLLVKSRENADIENPFDEGQSRVIFVIDGSTKNIAWSYELPFKVFSDTGGLYEVKITPDLNKDGKSDIIAYLQYPGDWNKDDTYGEKTRIMVFDGKTGRIIMNRSVVDCEYYGIYEQLFKDNLNKTVQEMIPEQQMAEEKIREILGRKSDVKIKKRIYSLDTIQDQSNDSIPDLIIGSWEDVYVMDSVNGNILWNRTRRPDLYQNPFTGEISGISYNWTQHDRNRFFAVGDANNDGINDLVLVDWDGLTFLQSRGKDYYAASKLTTKDGLNKDGATKIGDLNGNGVQDIFFEKFVQDAPSVFTIVDGKDGKILMEMERSGTDSKLSAADFNGNGFQDSIIFQMWTETGGPKLEVVDGNTRDVIWSYNGIEEAWMIRDIFGYSSAMPAAPVNDINGDGITDIAVARSLPWQLGAEVLIYDVKNNQELKRIVIEEIETGGDNRWMPGINAELLHDINNDGKNDLGVILAVGEVYNKKVKIFIIDVEKGDIISDFSSQGSDIIKLGNESVGMIGGSGNIYFLYTSKDLSITSPRNGSVTGSPIRVEWTSDRESVATILVDNKRTLITEDKKAVFEILSKEHKITVYSFDRYGKGVYDSVYIIVEKSSGSVTIVLIVVLILLIILFSPKIYDIILRVRK